MDWPTKDEIADIVRGAPGWDAPTAIADAILTRLAPLRAESARIESEFVDLRDAHDDMESDWQLALPIVRAALAYVESPEEGRVWRGNLDYLIAAVNALTLAERAQIRGA